MVLSLLFLEVENENTTVGSVPIRLNTEPVSFVALGVSCCLLLKKSTLKCLNKHLKFTRVWLISNPKKNITHVANVYSWGDVT